MRIIHDERHRMDRVGWLRAGGSPMLKAAIRVTFWGTLAMGITAAVGKIFGTIV